MRILVNAVAAKIGGAIGHLRSFVSGVKERGGEHRFFILVDEGSGLKSDAGQVELVPIRSGTGFGRMVFDQLRLPRLARELGCDVILSLLNHGPFGAELPQVVFQRNSNYFCPYFGQQTRGRRRLVSSIKGWAAYLTMRSSRIIVTPTESVRQMIRTCHPDLPASRFRVLPNPFEPERVRPHGEPSERVSEMLSSPPAGRPRLLYVSHPGSHKGVPVLLAGLAELLAMGSQAELWLTMQREDSPVDIDEYERLIRQLGIGGSVRFIGRIPPDDIGHVYAAADVFVFPSLCESFGYPMWEAVANGLPIVAAGTPVNREVCGPAALYYPPLDHRELASTLAELLGSPAALAHRREATAAFASGWTYVTPTEYVARLVTFLEEALEVPG